MYCVGDLKTIMQITHPFYAYGLENEIWVLIASKVKQACTYTQTCQSLHFSHSQSMEIEDLRSLAPMDMSACPHLTEAFVHMR